MKPSLPLVWSGKRKIYKRILDSEVLIVLVGPGTSKSEWVKREIALANALGISVVPVGSDLGPDEMMTELKALGIDRFQGKITANIKLSAGKALISELRNDLSIAGETTKRQQDMTLRGLLNRRSARPAKAPDKQSAAAFKLSVEDTSIELCVATGDVTKVRGIDVLVNSENDYLQMARFFESKTVSSTLRRLGASVQNGNYADTIQAELDFHLRSRGRPVQAGEVFATSSGGPTSELATLLRARFILHVAAVQAVVAEATVVPYQQPYQIEACVRNCLSKIMEINRINGIISPPGTPQHLEQVRLAPEFAPIASIIFPMFGTGHGGAKVADVLGPLVSGMQGFFQEPDGKTLGRTLKQIYISVFANDDVQQVVDFLTVQVGNQIM